ncbi:hypothetical protein HK097_010657 [Rhizophlyctis rosea]|uniref:Peroxidase n=1 Tax=Rhizophlyctis rosea TaxID=64517 RepID=A0AAD5S7B0_9FUNG|nr:hypothetical protein HK097_010657 [Rhizophlyctis rosea]
MRILSTTTICLILSSCLAGSSAVPTLERRQTGCDSALWNRVKGAIMEQFGSRPCSPLGRAAIRLYFHDAGTYDTKDDTGGPNGSVMRFDSEANQPQNNHLRDVILALRTVYDRFSGQVSRADIINLAGLLGTQSCPGGASIPFFIGRKDSTTPDDASRLPGDTEPMDNIISKFQRQGLTNKQLAALIGAHTTGKRFSSPPSEPVNGNAGLAFDSTPEVWDLNYYNETLQQPTSPPLGQTRIQVDVAISRDPRTKNEFARYVTDFDGWTKDFTEAMVVMGKFGRANANLIKCDGVVPAAIPLPGGNPTPGNNGLGNGNGGGNGNGNGNGNGKGIGGTGGVALALPASGTF